MAKDADICLILEGTYPFVTGGVSHWVHELIREQNHLRFTLVAIVPQDAELELKYKLPQNVIGLHTVRLAALPDGTGDFSGIDSMHDALHEPLFKLTREKAFHLADLERMIQALRPHRQKLGSHALLNHLHAWDDLIALYEANFEEHSFIDFFWSYRAIVGGIYSILLADLPDAGVYHAMSTGYAGLMAARARIETDRPTILTEHGIYTNERRIEVASADWLEASASTVLSIDKPRRDLRDLWIDSIGNFSQVCYEACNSIVTLFKGNQHAQIEDGADARKLRIIPNGVDLKRFDKIPRKRSGERSIALIGRVVPIKDIKTYIRSIDQLRQFVPDIKAYVLGPTNEDPDYFEECQTMIALLGLEQHIEFTGRVNVEDFLSSIDVLVLTSLSEAQPLVLQEAGACGIPLVATDVGACRELIEGTEEEEPYGAGGFVVPLANPYAVAQAVYTLLNDQRLYDQCSAAIKQRISRYYNSADHQHSYRDLYAGYLNR